MWACFNATRWEEKFSPHLVALNQAHVDVMLFQHRVKHIFFTVTMQPFEHWTGTRGGLAVVPSHHNGPVFKIFLTLYYFYHWTESSNTRDLWWVLTFCIWRRFGAHLCKSRCFSTFGACLHTQTAVVCGLSCSPKLDIPVFAQWNPCYLFSGFINIYIPLFWRYEVAKTVH